MVTNPLAGLQRAWANRNLIPVVGAGVSIAAANLPTWARLLESGVKYVEKNKKDLRVLKQQLSAVKTLARAGQLETGFEVLQKLLGGAPDSDFYQAFLNEQFGRPHVTDSRTLEALRQLGARIIVTTNYDLLLEDQHVVPDGDTTTWLEPQRILSFLRGDRGIIHLHGRYDLPQSVILSAPDYARIVHRPDDSKTIAEALFHAGVLMFVGCSLDSVHDNHLKEMLTHFSRLHGPILEEAAIPHYMLVRGQPEDRDVVKLRKLGIIPISYGADYSDLPSFLHSIPHRPRSRVTVEDMRNRLYTLRTARSLSELLSDIRLFLEGTVYPGRQIRVGFAAKIEERSRTLLRNKYLPPIGATHNDFSYPQTLAAWALIEGRILAFPGDLDRHCDFDHLKNLRKYERIRHVLLATDVTADPVLADFLNAEGIKEKTEQCTLTLRDIYQHWVARQPKPHYSQFISVPVPVVDRITITSQDEPPEFGVINIDTMEESPLLTEGVTELLKLVSDLVGLGFQRLDSER